MTAFLIGLVVVVFLVVLNHYIKKWSNGEVNLGSAVLALFIILFLLTTGVTVVTALGKLVIYLFGI